MAYTKTVWQDHIVTTPNTYTMAVAGDSTWTILPSEGTVIQTGTPVNAANLNKIEDELESLDTGKLDMSGGTLTGWVTAPAFVANSAGFRTRSGNSSGYVMVVRDNSDQNRTIVSVASNNRLYFRNYVTTGGSVYEDYYFPAPAATSNIQMDLTVQKSLGNTSSTASKAFTLPKAGRWLIATAGTATSSLFGLWIANTSGNTIVNIGGGSNITFTLSGTTLTAAATSAGSAQVYGIFLG